MTVNCADKAYIFNVRTLFWGLSDDEQHPDLKVSTCLLTSRRAPGSLHTQKKNSGGANPQTNKNVPKGSNFDVRTYMFWVFFVLFSFFFCSSTQEQHPCSTLAWRWGPFVCLTVVVVVFLSAPPVKNSFPGPCKSENPTQIPSLPLSSHVHGHVPHSHSISKIWNLPHWWKIVIRDSQGTASL